MVTKIDQDQFVGKKSSFYYYEFLYTICRSILEGYNNIYIYDNHNTDKINGGASFKKTSEKVMFGKMQRVVYKGARGVKYVKMRGTFVKLSEAKKSMQKKK